MISQVLRIGLFYPLDMILKLADENQKKSTFSETQKVRAAR
jgi:hypothetical protein